MDGQSVTYANTGTGAQYANSPGAKQMTVWFDFFNNDTRYWELEPYFDVDGGRALALEDTEYVVYMEKPGPLELVVEKHGYDIYWVNPIDGRVHQRQIQGRSLHRRRRPTNPTIGCCTWCAKAASKA